jgi:hypothetical protein
MCGAKMLTLPEECMSDNFAQILPICEDCKAVYKERFGRDFRQGSPTKSEEQVEGLFLVDFRQLNIKAHRRLSEKHE